MARNGILAPLSLIFIAGAIVLTLFIFLAGVSNTTPLNNTYFLTADTSGITGARETSQWTYFYVCGPNNLYCSGAWPAPAVGWAWDSNAANVPGELAGSEGNGTTNKYYYYLWRFGWVLFLIALFFTVVAFFAGFLACCGRLGSAIAALASLLALFFESIAVSLMTVCFVKMRNVFLAAGRNADIGTYAFGFAWGAWAAIFIATILFCLGMRSSKDSVSTTGGGRRWGRKRSVRSRRSYDMGSRRVKDDYS